MGQHASLHVEFKYINTKVINRDNQGKAGHMVFTQGRFHLIFSISKFLPGNAASNPNNELMLPPNI